MRDIARRLALRLGVVGLMYPEDWPEPEIAWTVFDSGEGRGIAYEAALASRSYGYDTLGLSTLVSLIKSDNVRVFSFIAARLNSSNTFAGFNPNTCRFSGVA